MIVISIIGIFVIIMLLLSIFIGIPLYQYNIWYTLIMILVNIIAVTIIDAIIAFVVNQLPNKWFNHKNKSFYIFKWERKFYESLNIRKWKDKIPELGKLANFRKNKVQKPNDNEYINKFIEECCYGEIVHLVSIFLGFLIILIKPKYFLFFGLPVAIGNAIINYLPYMILRYNRPKLVALYERNKRKEYKKN